MKRLALWAALLLLSIGVPAEAAAPLRVVAAENFYGDIAEQIGGAEVEVRSILGNPDEDPHLFEASPSVARALAAARIAIYNGIGYDPWMAKLLHAASGRDRKVIVVAELVGRKAGDNPHIWYDPATMPALAKALAAALGAADPAHRALYLDRLEGFTRSMRPIEARVAALRARLEGVPVTATEPVFGYMLAALGLKSRNARFQLAVMNNTEPAASDLAAFENDLKSRRVAMLLYNRQASGPLARRMVTIAKAASIPVVGASETEPPGENYQAWMSGELDAVGRALAPASR